MPGCLGLESNGRGIASAPAPGPSPKAGEGSPNEYIWLPSLILMGEGPGVGACTKTLRGDADVLAAVCIRRAAVVTIADNGRRHEN